MKRSQSTRLAATIFMMAFAGFVSNIVADLVLSGYAKHFLVPFITVLVCLPFILFFHKQDNKQIKKEKQELEERYMAEDAELLKQANKHHG